MKTQAWLFGYRYACRYRFPSYAWYRARTALRRSHVLRTLR